MSTIGYENWAVDLADVAAIYPFQGWEVYMTIVCVAFWLGWHIKQFRDENAELEAATKAFNADKASQAIDRY